MDFFKLLNDATLYFPKINIKYKDESLGMKILGKALFFNKTFMTEYITTIGSTVYFPSRKYIDSRPLSSSIILMHEMVHINDSKKLGFLYPLLYLSPQILCPILGLIFLLFSWKLALFSLIFLLPFPAYFRMKFEKRAYFASLYILKALSVRYGFASMLRTNKDYFLKQFKTSAYYYMWVFKDLDKEFEEVAKKVAYMKKPFEDKIFDVFDDLISKN